MIAEIDKKSGFCFGVIRAIDAAEAELKSENQLYCLGDIVHNEMEVNRLQDKGLKVISHEELKKLNNTKVLLRAHGEPPETYKLASENNISLIDASCPIVLKLQQKVKSAYEEMKKINGQLIIYGKHGHAEVIGLSGQTKNTAIVIEKSDEIDKIDFSKAIRLFAQTTKSIEEYAKLKELISERIKMADNGNSDFVAYDSICRQVSNRYEELKKFSMKYDVIIFVSGKNSSNGKFLFEICKSVNNKTYFVSDSSELERAWFDNIEYAGICGATSTPMWLMEEIANIIRSY